MHSTALSQTWSNVLRQDGTDSLTLRQHNVSAVSALLEIMSNHIETLGCSMLFSSPVFHYLFLLAQGFSKAGKRSSMSGLWSGMLPDVANNSWAAKKTFILTPGMFVRTNIHGDSRIWQACFSPRSCSACLENNTFWGRLCCGSSLTLANGPVWQFS